MLVSLTHHIPTLDNKRRRDTEMAPEYRVKLSKPPDKCFCEISDAYINQIIASTECFN